MQEELISFDTAKLAKEKKFNEYCTNGYITRRVLGLYFNSKFEQYKYGGDNSELLELCQNISFIPLYEPYYKTPTQSLLQKWLREKHNINVLIEFDSISYGYRLIYVDEHYTDKVVFEMWDSYEEALEMGLQEALKLVPNKNK